MAPFLDLSSVGAGWYNDERGADEFNFQDFVDRESAGERKLFDINGRSERFSAGIGAKWYYAKDDMTMDDRKSHPFLHLSRYIDRCSCSDQRYPH